MEIYWSKSVNWTIFDHFRQPPQVQVFEVLKQIEGETILGHTLGVRGCARSLKRTRLRAKFPVYRELTGKNTPF